MARVVLYYWYMPVYCGFRLYVAGLAGLLDGQGAFEEVHVVMDLPRGYALLDHRPNLNYFSSTIVVTDCPSPYYIHDVLRKKPQALLFRPEAGDLRRAIIAVIGGKTLFEIPSHLQECPEILTPREAQVLRLILRGYSNQEISNELQVKPQTVHNWVYRILEKMGLKHRTQIPLSYYGYLPILFLYVCPAA